MRDQFNYTWIEPGKILAGSIPTCGEDIDTLASLGITYIFTLTRRGLLSCQDIATKLGEHQIFWGHFPIPDCGLPDDKTNLDNMLSIMNAFYTATPFYIHCRGGIGRTGMILQLFYLSRGYTLEQAREMVSCRWNIQHVANAAQQGSPQREFIESWKSHES